MPRRFRHERDIDRYSLAVTLADAQLDRQARAAAAGSSTVDEAFAADVQTLAIFRQDESVILRVVEPQHRAVHSCGPTILLKHSTVPVAINTPSLAVYERAGTALNRKPNSS
jgi:hypothetical protein